MHVVNDLFLACFPSAEPVVYSSGVVAHQLSLSLIIFLASDYLAVNLASTFSLSCSFISLSSSFVVSNLAFT